MSLSFTNFYCRSLASESYKTKSRAGKHVYACFYHLNTRDSCGFAPNQPGKFISIEMAEESNMRSQDPVKPPIIPIEGLPSILNSLDWVHLIYNHVRAGLSEPFRRPPLDSREIHSYASYASSYAGHPQPLRSELRRCHNWSGLFSDSQTSSLRLGEDLQNQEDDTRTARYNGDSMGQNRKCI